MMIGQLESITNRKSFLDDPKIEKILGKITVIPLYIKEEEALSEALRTPDKYSGHIPHSHFIQISTKL
jgi:hypothetical protein